MQTWKSYWNSSSGESHQLCAYCLVKGQQHYFLFWVPHNLTTDLVKFYFISIKFTGHCSLINFIQWTVADSGAQQSSPKTPLKKGYRFLELFKQKRDTLSLTSGEAIPVLLLQKKFIEILDKIWISSRMFQECMEKSFIPWTPFLQQVLCTCRY